MKMKRNVSIIGAVLLMIGASAVSASAEPGASGGGSAAPGYNAIPAHVSANVPSVGFQATQTRELGDLVGLSGQARTLRSMTVLFSSWACQDGEWDKGDCVTTPGATFPAELTFNVYDPSNLTATLATTTQTVNMPFRPSASTLCTGANAGKWYNKSDQTCYNGFPQAVELAFPAGTVLPDSVVWSVAYKTSSTGSTIAAMDSLNVGVQSFENAPYSGTDLDEDQAFWNGALDTGWTGLRPLGQISTVK